MIKKIFIVLLIAGFFGCTKKQVETLDDCPAQACTLMFASINVQFQDKNGNPVAVKDFTVVNQRTKESLVSSTPGMSGYYTIVNDSMRSKLSTSGDDIVVTATHPTNGQTKSTTYKISGGCNCHVERISGPQVIVFD